MPFARAESHRSPARPVAAGQARRARLVGLVGLVLALALAGCSGGTSIPPPAAPSSSSERVAAALRTIASLDAALVAADGAGAAALGAGGAADLLRDAATNVDRLGLDQISLRYVQEVPASTVAGTAGFGPDSWQATVAVEYRLADWDPRATRLETVFTFVPGTSGQQVAAIGSATGRTPLWLTGEVTASIAGRALVLSRGAGPEKLSRTVQQARQALRDVDAVLTDWRGTLVIEAAATEVDFDRSLGATREQYANIAAVTGSVDGSAASGSPLHIFLNPAVFDRLGPRAAQIVVSHEATHVATQAPFTPAMPTWLIEGFADYVALVGSGIGVQRAAAQALAQMEREGLPEALPTDADLSTTAPGLGAAYEEAWLVNRYLAAEYGESQLLAFYDAVDRGESVTVAFREVLGTTEAQFVAGWRADLRGLVAARQS